MNNNKVETIISEEQEQVLLGTLMGDGNLHKVSRNAIFSVNHREDDREYLFWKYSKLESTKMFLNPPSIQTIKNTEGSRSPGLYHQRWFIRSRSLPFLNDYYQTFYPDEKKVLPLRVLNKMEPLALAVWYMDDGSLHQQPRIKLSTESFTREENEIIKGWLGEKFNLHFRVSDQFGGSGFGLVSVGGYGGVVQFFDIVKPYVSQVPCMRRKIELVKYLDPSKWRQRSYK